MSGEHGQCLEVKGAGASDDRSRVLWLDVNTDTTESRHTCSTSVSEHKSGCVCQVA